MVDYVFLHGGGQGSWIWEETIAALRLQEPGARTLALDIPGSGTKRGRDIESLSMADITAELAAELDAAGIEDGLMVGHSMAGIVLPSLAVARPSRLRRLAYVSCIAPLKGQSVVSVIGSSRRGENPEEVGWPLDPAVHPHEAQMGVFFCNDMSELETREFLAKLGRDVWPQSATQGTDWSYEAAPPVPATYVVLLQDQALPREWQERFADRFAAARRVYVDAAHQVMNTRPHTLAEVLRAEARVS